MESKLSLLNCVKKTTALFLSGMLSLSMVAVVDAAPKKEVDLNGKYHASMGIQTSTETWLTHMGYYDKELNKDFGTDAANHLWAADASADGSQPQAGTFTDVEIAGNGTYTLKLEDADFAVERSVSQLHIATDIPGNDTIKFTNVKAKINGKDVVKFDEGWMEEEEPYTSGGMVVLLFNHWRADLVQELATKGLAEDTENGWDLMAGSGKENIEISFTVSGFAYDNPDAVEETPTPEPTKAADAGVDDSADDSSDDDSASPVLPIAAGVVVVVIVGIVIVIAVRKKK